MNETCGAVNDDEDPPIPKDAGGSWPLPKEELFEEASRDSTLKVEPSRDNIEDDRPVAKGEAPAHMRQYTKIKDD